MEIQGYNLPDNLYYEENHFWVKDEGDLLVMGMDDFAQQMAGEIVYVQLPDEGKQIKAGKKFAKMESGKWLGKVYGPVNGELAAVNEELEENFWLVADSTKEAIFDLPFETTWEDTLSKMEDKYKIWTNFPENPELN